MHSDKHSHNHSHSHGAHHHHGDNATKNISTAFVLNAVFVVIEIVGGLMTNSIAILSDALHDLGDCVSLGVAWGLQKKSTKGRDRKYSYGYKRFSLLGSVFLSGILTISSIFVIVEAIGRIASPQVVDATGMMWLAVAGVAVNGAAALKLKRGTSINERAVFLHIMEDAMGWVAVLVVSIVMNFVDLPVLDPVLSVAISLWVLFNVYRNIRATFRVFMQAIPDGVDMAVLEERVEGVSGVESVHDVHLWTLDGESHIMTLHAAVSDTAQGQRIKHDIIEVASHYGVEHVTIELEPVGMECLHNCDR